MARMCSVAAAVVVMVVGVLVGGVPAFKTYAYYDTPTVFYPPTYHNAPPIFQPLIYSGKGVGPVTVRMEEVALLACPKEGFYVHPTNSSRFYRCVDHTQTGQFFVRYVFECPTNFIFAIELKNCVPGHTQPDLVITSTQPPAPPASSVPPTDPPAPPSPSVPTTDPPAPSVPPTDPPAPPAPSVPTTDLPAPSVPPTDPPAPSVPITDPPAPSVPITDPPAPSVPPTDPPAPSVPPTDPSVQPPTTTFDESCRGQYVQHVLYCNVYRRCNDTETRYMCPPGLVFVQERQMCRINAADGVWCAGRSIATFPFHLRTELVEGHIRLPHHFVLHPITSPLTRHSQTYPANTSPHLHYHTQHPANTPPHIQNTLNIPNPHSAYPYAEQGVYSTYPNVVKSQTLSLIRPGPLTSPYSVQGHGNPPPMSLNNVRHPQHHLHFPSYLPYSYGHPEGAFRGHPYATLLR